MLRFHASPPAPKADFDIADERGWPSWMTEAQISACEAVLVGWDLGLDSEIEDLSDKHAAVNPKAESNVLTPGPLEGKWHGRLRKRSATVKCRRSTRQKKLRNYP
ncbi:hypothetical protein B0H11DRAFT_1928901 [Mycena galericulata]|nr:hypothetical protein B0H11DRAFT_1928901 [Mycena galericulata]